MVALGLHGRRRHLPMMGESVLCPVAFKAGGITFPVTGECAWSRVDLKAGGSTFSIMGERVRRCVFFVGWRQRLPRNGGARMAPLGLHSWQQPLSRKGVA
jgi:hypothetical protein